MNLTSACRHLLGSLALALGVAGGAVAQTVPADTPPAQAPANSPAPASADSDKDPAVELRMASLAAELRRAQASTAGHPRKKFFSASSHDPDYEAYMRAYVARLERIGTLNFPDEARRRHLSGSVVVTVEIRRDGSLASVTTIQSSGTQLLDRAAEQTVRMAAPFPGLPHTKDDPDILNITRTFHYFDAGDWGGTTLD